ncbi:hypothetical protein QBC47DRAFT_408018 [Echria macrotheca]|uniref:Uncharacterized protein n=1 Tax=Echria macrotheca TaxID=438768 RepID=A0AAJ0B0J3_9PEZI|nr:hypothetical protein QBC47DRAFT_408018 [Echria macrotheca]
MNASWGVSPFPATFSYTGPKSELAGITNLADMMRLLNGKSPLCLGTTAFDLGVGIHNASYVEMLNYHGPPY